MKKIKIGDVFYTDEGHRITVRSISERGNGEIIIYYLKERKVHSFFSRTCRWSSEDYSQPIRFFGRFFLNLDKFKDMIMIKELKEIEI